MCSSSHRALTGLLLVAIPECILSLQLAQSPMAQLNTAIPQERRMAIHSIESSRIVAGFYAAAGQTCTPDHQIADKDTCEAAGKALYPNETWQGTHPSPSLAPPFCHHYHSNSVSPWAGTWFGNEEGWEATEHSGYKSGWDSAEADNYTSICSGLHKLNASGGTELTIRGRNFDFSESGPSIIVEGVRCQHSIWVSDTYLACITSARSPVVSNLLEHSDSKFAHSLVVKIGGQVASIVAGFEYEGTPPPNAIAITDALANIAELKAAPTGATTPAIMLASPEADVANLSSPLSSPALVWGYWTVTRERSVLGGSTEDVFCGKSTDVLSFSCVDRGLTSLFCKYHYGDDAKGQLVVNQEGETFGHPNFCCHEDGFDNTEAPQHTFEANAKCEPFDGVTNTEHE